MCIRDSAKATNPDKVKGTLADAIKGADVFIGVSVPDSLNEDMIRSMAKDPIIFAQANPIPEIWPIERATQAGAKVVACLLYTSCSITAFLSPVSFFSVDA